MTRARIRPARAAFSAANRNTSAQARDAAPALERRIARRGRHAQLRGSSALSAAALAGSLFAAGAAWATPQGGVVVEGSAEIVQTSPTSIEIRQSSDKVIIEWQSFDIGEGESVDFVQPSEIAAALNRVLSGQASAILGNLTANGQIVISNPKGINFGAGAKVDVASIVATSLGILNQNFMAGRMVFDQPGDPGAVVSNAGQITAKQGGLAALVAPGVENSGVIAAKLGTVALAAGNAAVLDFYGDGLVQIAITAPVTQTPVDADGNPVAALASNTGAIYAEGGTVVITAEAAEGVLDRVVNLEGVVQAQTIENREGQIALVGGSTGEVRVAGTVDASGTDAGESGGTVHVLGEKVQLADGASVDVSGDAGGGTVLIGGEAQGKDLQRSSGLAYKKKDGGGTAIVVSKDLEGDGSIQRAQVTYFDAGAKADASAKTNGDGGKVIVWADQATAFHGTITATGGAEGGDGGFVEVSARNLGFGGFVTTVAVSGAAGTLLLDPVTATIGAADTNDGSLPTIPATAAGTEFFISVAGLLGSLQNNALTSIGASSKITVNETVNNSGAGSQGDLQLAAPTVELNASILLGNGQLLGGEGNPGLPYVTRVDVFDPADDRVGSIQNALDLIRDLDGGCFCYDEIPVIKVGAGTFVENLLIDKPVKLLGSNASVDAFGVSGIDPNLFPRTEETIIAPLDFGFGSTITVIDDNVTIAGFTIKKQNGFVNDRTDWAISNYNDEAGFVSVSRLSVKYNIIQSLEGLGENEEIGAAQALDSFDGSEGGVLLGFDGGEPVQQFNSFISNRLLDVSDVGIALYGNVGFLIQDNVIADAGGLGTANGIYVGNSHATPFEYYSIGTILGNSLQGTNASESAGIIVGAYDEVLIAENSIQGYTYGVWIIDEYDVAEVVTVANSETGDGKHERDWYDEGARPSRGVTIFNNAIPGRFNGSPLSGNEFGIRVDSPYYSSASHYGEYTSIGPVNASGNWWGTTDQVDIANLMVSCPYACGVEVGNAGVDIPDERPHLVNASYAVDFTPYLHTATDTNTSYDPDAVAWLLGTPDFFGRDIPSGASVLPGFQGDFEVLHTTTLGAQTPIFLERVALRLEKLHEDAEWEPVDPYDFHENVVPLGRIFEGGILNLSPFDADPVTGSIIIEGTIGLEGTDHLGGKELDFFNDGTRSFTPHGELAYIDPFILVYKPDQRYLAANNASLTAFGVGNAPPLTYAPLGYPGAGPNVVGEIYPPETGAELANANNPIPGNDPDGDGRNDESIVYGSFFILPRTELHVLVDCEACKIPKLDNGLFTKIVEEPRVTVLENSSENSGWNSCYPPKPFVTGYELDLLLDGSRTEVNGLTILNIGAASELDKVQALNVSSANDVFGTLPVAGLLGGLFEESIAGIFVLGSGGHLFANNIIDGALYHFDPTMPYLVSQDTALDQVAVPGFGSGIWFLHGGGESQGKAGDTLRPNGNADDLLHTLVLQNDIRNWGSTLAAVSQPNTAFDIAGLDLEKLFISLFDNGGIKATNLSDTDVSLLNSALGGGTFGSEGCSSDFCLTPDRLVYSGAINGSDVTIDVFFAPAKELVIARNTLQDNRKGMIFENVGNEGETAARIFENWIWDSYGDFSFFLTSNQAQQSSDPFELLYEGTGVQINLIEGLANAEANIIADLPTGGQSGTFIINENSFEGNPLAIVNLGPGEVTDGGDPKPSVGNWFGSDVLGDVQALLVGNVAIDPDPFRLFPFGTDAHPEIPGWQFPEVSAFISFFFLDQADLSFPLWLLGLDPTGPGWAQFFTQNQGNIIGPFYVSNAGAFIYSFGSVTPPPGGLAPAAGPGAGPEGGPSCAEEFFNSQYYEDSEACSQ